MDSYPLQDDDSNEESNSNEEDEAESLNENNLPSTRRGDTQEA